MMEGRRKLDIDVKPPVSDQSLIANMRHNMAMGYDLWSERPCAMIGGGPSLKQHIDVINSLDMSKFAMNQAAKMIERPDYVVVLDPAEHMADLPFIAKAVRGATYLVASQCHPSVFDALLAQGAPIQMFHVAGDAQRALDVRGVFGGPTGLGRAVPMAYEMGFRQFHIFGADSSRPTPDDSNHHAYPWPHGDGREVIDIWTPKGQGPFWTSSDMAIQAKSCVQLWRYLEREHHCTFTIYGDGLLPALWAETTEDRQDV